MVTPINSGKVDFLRGTFKFLWEELKTMNMPKIKALSKMTKGYFKIKRAETKTKKTETVNYIQ